VASGTWAPGRAREPLTLAYFTNRYGSASFTFIMTEVEQLRRLGHTVHTFSVRHPGQGEGVSEQVRREQAGTEYFLPPGRTLRGVLGLLVSVARTLLARPRRFAAALWLAQTSSADGIPARFRQIAYLLLACRLADRMRAKGVEHLHNHLGSASATIAMLASELSGIPFSLTIHGGQIFFEPRQWALGEKIARSTFTACVSAFCRSQCMLFVPHEVWPRLEVVRCGVDARFLEAPPPPVPDTPSLVCVGRLSEEKGHLVLLEAIKGLSISGVFVRLVLVGDGPLRPVLEERIGTLGLEGAVSITGLVGPEEVRRQVSAARAFVLASLTEGLPVAIMEAFAVGRPVVATNVGAVAELVRPGETGWLVSPGSVEALQEALGEALGTPVETLERMGLRGAALVAERHSASDAARKLSRLFEGTRALAPVSGAPAPRRGRPPGWA
jgi:colanic acid/amylovoran biosynthesis glycosyltransferase